MKELTLKVKAWTRVIPISKVANVRAKDTGNETTNGETTSSVGREVGGGAPKSSGPPRSSGGATRGCRVPMREV